MRARTKAFIWMSLLVAACAPLDRTAPFRSPAYAAAIDATERAIADPDANADRGPYEAGWARARIEAPPRVPLAGYAARRGAPSTGVRDPVYVRAFAIRAGRATVLLFTADLLLITPELAAAVRTRMRPSIAPDRIFFTASHTHSGPGAYAQGFLYELVFGAFDPRAFDAVVAAHAEAGARGLAALAPAKIGSADLEAPGLIENRVERDGPVDDRAFVLLFEHRDHGRAILWSFACHPVTLGPENLGLSADYPGAVAQALEGEAFEIVGFAAGGVGSSNPRRGRSSSPSRFSEPLIRALERARPPTADVGSLASAAVDAPLPAPRYRAATNVMAWPPLAAAILDTRSAPFGAVAVGDTTLAHVPVELSGELTRVARARAAAEGTRLALLPFNGKWLGYVVSSRTYDLDEARGAALFDYETRTMSFFGPHAGALFLNLAFRLATGVRDMARRSGERLDRTGP
jgi:neutral/alkaline ceramidase-like enzyme